MIAPGFVDTFRELATSPDPDLAAGALLVARLEYPRLDASRYLDQLDRLGETARARLEAAAGGDRLAAVRTLNAFLFKETGFTGNARHYDDPRNSCLNQVLERRTGIPITLAVVYIEVARRANIVMEGVNFPGHFLLRLRRSPTAPDEPDVILDPFREGAMLSEEDCRSLLRKHAGDDIAFEPRLLARASKQQILARMLANLKRLYVRMRSFPQGRTVTELLLAVNPSDLAELRDRGLFSYHLNDYAAALRDLEDYLRYTSHTDASGAKSSGTDRSDIWEHVKTLRRRVASLN